MKSNRPSCFFPRVNHYIFVVFLKENYAPLEVAYIPKKPS